MTPNVYLLIISACYQRMTSKGREADSSTQSKHPTSIAGSVKPMKVTRSTLVLIHHERPLASYGPQNGRMSMGFSMTPKHGPILGRVLLK